jgi:hypothetical protein
MPNALLNGDTSFTIHFGAFTQTMATGATIDFTQFVLGGVSDFVLSGFSDTLQLASDGAAPFVWGATYASAGVATVTITPVPEPATLVLGAFGGLALLGFTRRFR